MFEAVAMPWLDRVWERIRQSSENNRLPHAMLVIGEHGAGKRLFADQLAALLVCEHPDVSRCKPCGHCKQCELTSATTHPDIRFYAPEKSRVIKVAQIRALSTFAVASPQVAARKIAIIDRADQLNINAANALLKTLEEPAADMILILLQEGGRPVLPTIRSRCQMVAVPTPSRQQGLEWLGAQLERLQLETPPTGDQCDRALRLAAYAPRLALDYLTGDFMELRSQALEQFRQFMKGQVSVGEAAGAFKALGLEASLWLFEGWAADLARLGVGGSARDQEASDMLGYLAGCNPSWRAHELIDLVHESRSAAVYNVNPELEVSRLLIAWQKLMPVKRSVPGH